MPSKRVAHFTYGSGRQRGAALLIIMVIVVVGIAAALINSLTSSKVKVARMENTASALAQAKEALIGFAITYGDTHSNQAHGYLPCPDGSGGNPEGSAEPSCGSQDVSVIGRLPWATLDISSLRDGDGECLWYAVSGSYKNNPKTSLMNWDTNGKFMVFSSDGILLTQPDNQVVAVIIAPSATQTGQNRTGSAAPVCGGNYSAANYLDNDTAHGINNADVSAGKFILGSNSGLVNDQILFITRQDIWNATKKRNDFSALISTLLSTTATNLATLPSPVTINFDNTPFTESGFATAGTLNIGRVPKLNITPPWDNWQDNLLYATCSGGCLTVNGASCSGVVIFTGERNGSQARITNADKNTWGNYLEDTPNANLTAFTGGTSFLGTTPFSTGSPSTDILAACIP